MGGIVVDGVSAALGNFDVGATIVVDFVLGKVVEVENNVVDLVDGRVVERVDSSVTLVV